MPAVRGLDPAQEGVTPVFRDMGQCGPGGSGNIEHERRRKSQAVAGPARRGTEHDGEEEPLPEPAVCVHRRAWSSGGHGRTDVEDGQFRNSPPAVRVARAHPLTGRADMKRTIFGALAAGLLILPAAPAAAQVYITPAVGVFIPASDLEDLEGQAEQTRFDRSGTLGLGLNLEFGWLRGSIAYATGANISEEGVDGEVGDGSVLAAAADLVVRPLPRILVQPYLL